jgi:hypothetical protein
VGRSGSSRARPSPGIGGEIGVVNSRGGEEGGVGELYEPTELCRGVE